MKKRGALDGVGVLLRARNKRMLLVAILLAVSLGGIVPSRIARAEEAATTISGTADSVKPTALFAEVIDTYKSFTTANYPDKNVQKFDITYRQLRFPRGYRLSDVRMEWSSAGFGPNGYLGIISKHKCVYTTW